MKARDRALQDVSLSTAWENLRSDYAASKNSRFRPAPTGVVPSGSGADYHYRDHTAYLRMVERSRFFDRNNVIVAQGVDRLISNVVQDGFTNDIDTGDKATDQELSKMWSDWTADEEQCDIEGEKCWYELEQLVPRHIIVDGDIIGLGLRSGQLEMAEAHRLRHPRRTTRNVVHGILLDDRPSSYGRRLEYWLSRDDLSPNKQINNVRDIRRFPVRDGNGNRQVFHPLNPRRVSQRRGVTAFAPAVDYIGMHDDLQFATLVKAQVASCFAVFEEVEKDVQRAGAATKTGNETTEELSDGTTRTIQGIAPGMRVGGQPGVKYHGFSPNIPNPEFFPHATLLLSFIAVNLDLPVHVLMLDPANTNFSGWRGAMDQARISFRRIQRFLIKKWYAPVYRFKVRQFIQQSTQLQTAFRNLGPDIFRHTWNPPTWRYIEPMKDAAADDMRVSRNLISQRRRAAEQGYDWGKLRVEIVQDRSSLVRDAIAEAKAIEADTGVEVDWRELAYGHQTSGVRYTFGSDLGEPQQQPEPRVNGFNRFSEMNHA